MKLGGVINLHAGGESCRRKREKSRNTPMLKSLSNGGKGKGSSNNARNFPSSEKKKRGDWFGAAGKRGSQQKNPPFSELPHRGERNRRGKRKNRSRRRDS